MKPIVFLALVVLAAFLLLGRSWGDADALKKQVDELQQQVKQSEMALANERANYQALSEKMNVLRQQLAQAQADKRELQLQYDALSAELARKSTELEQAAASLKALNKRVSDLETALKTTEVAPKSGWPGANGSDWLWLPVLAIASTTGATAVRPWVKRHWQVATAGAGSAQATAGELQSGDEVLVRMTRQQARAYAQASRTEVAAAPNRERSQ